MTDPHRPLPLKGTIGGHLPQVAENNTPQSQDASGEYLL